MTEIIRDKCPICGATRTPSGFPGGRDWINHYWHDCDPDWSVGEE